MKTLIVGVGALGGTLAARLLAAGTDVSLAARTPESVAELERTGLRVTGIGVPVAIKATRIATLRDYAADDSFELIVVATKAQEAIELAPALPPLLRAGGTLLPIQNGGVSPLLATRLGADRVLGGISNLGATMIAVGDYAQTNAGHLLVGELGGGLSARAERVAGWLRQGIDVRITGNMSGAIWSKLLLNCSVTTIGALAGRTMREYFALAGGRELFQRAYDEALSVALASAARPERMIVEPVPPGWIGRSVPSDAHDAWLNRILSAYGDAKSSMLQDLERGRTTEIDFINGYVATLGRQLGIDTVTNTAIAMTVSAISRGELRPDPMLLRRLVEAA